MREAQRIQEHTVYSFVEVKEGTTLWEAVTDVTSRKMKRKEVEERRRDK